MKWLENPGKKIIALLLGFLAWYYVESLSTVRRAYYSRIHYKNMPSGMTAIYMPKRVRYYVTTNNYYHQEKSLPEVSFEVSLKRAKVGRNYLKIVKKLKSSLPPSMNVELAKKKVRVILDKKKAKRVPIKANIRNNLSPEYLVRGLKIIPSQVTLSGPASRLKGIKYVELATINVSRPGFFAFKKKLKSMPVKLQISHNRVQIKFEVRANMIEQKLNLPIKIRKLALGLRVKKIKPGKAFFTVRGRFGKLKKFDFKSLFYYIDLDKVKKAGKYRFNLKKRKLDGLELKPVKKKKIEVELKKAE